MMAFAALYPSSPENIMAVLVEAISVIVRVQAIHDRYPGGWSAFVDNAPNKTLCSDNELVRIGFMNPDDCKLFVDSLERLGLTYLKDGQSHDIVIVDQNRGQTVPCGWLDYGRIDIRPNQTVAAAQLKGTTSRQVYCPDNWTFENSVSRQYGFVPTGHQDKSLKFLRREKGLDVYLNLLTGKEVYIGRTDIKTS
jgi:hypothetical protein